MEFDTLDYIYILIGVAWLAALAGGVVAIFSHRSLQRRQSPARLNSRWGRLVLEPVMAAAALIPPAGLAVLLAVGWFAFTQDMFALVRIAYYQIAVVPPLLGLYLLLQRRKRDRAEFIRPGIIASLALLAPAPICAYASFIAPYQLVIERADVPLQRLRNNATPIKIAVIADLQTAKITDYERRAIDLALAEKPDLILLPGDFFQCSWRQWKAGEADFRTEMKRLASAFGTFAVLGDVDDLGDMTELLAGTPVRLLNNEIAVIDVRGQRIAIGGVELRPGTRASDATITRLGAIQCDARILLAHRPDLVLHVDEQDDIDLVIAGHTHGGQIVIPGFGPPVTLTDIPRSAAAGGLHVVNGKQIYVSRGVGCEHGSAPPMRLFCPPELSILTLMKSAPAPATAPNS